MNRNAIQLAQKEDIPMLLEVFESSIKTIASKDYSPAEIKEWLKSTKNYSRWESLISEQVVFMVVKENKTVGFGSLKNSDYIDFMYVHGQHQKQGIAQSILDALLQKAKDQGTRIITSDVSHTARPFFEKNGFSVVHQNENKRGTEVLVNFKMQLHLSTV